MNDVADNGKRNTLVVLLHAYNQKASNLIAVKEAVREVWPQSHVCSPELPATWLSMASPDRIVADVLAEVDRLYAQSQSHGQAFDSIVLIGHSLGALLVRKLYVVACGELSMAPLESEYRSAHMASDARLLAARPWAGKVSRIVLMAGINRGWKISHHLGLFKTISWTLGSIICHGIHTVTGKCPLIFSIRRGAEFITQLRIQWILMRHGATYSQNIKDDDGGEARGNALTIQLLGSRDDVVAPEDNLDLVSGGDFIYLDVPYSGHISIVELNEPEFGSERKRIFSLALMGTLEALRHASIVPSDERFSGPNTDVKRMVFVIHGIRDVGYWTHKIARRIKQQAGRTGNQWATETSTYGYFPMLPFLLPWCRRQKVEWLMDQYTEALARYPCATISYVGHSNGTYLLAKALELYPCCAFHNVVFAGSVVPRSYDWERFLGCHPPRINAVLNFVASADWVVAFFPNLFQFLRVQDLGSAGHDGFVKKNARIYQVKYVVGGHGAAIEEPVWDAIADFVITGEPKAFMIQQFSQSRNRWVTLFGAFPPLIWSLIGAVLFAGWMLIQLVLIMITPPDVRPFVTGIAMAAYVGLLWIILTRL